MTIEIIADQCTSRPIVADEVGANVVEGVGFNVVEGAAFGESPGKLAGEGLGHDVAATPKVLPS